MKTSRAVEYHLRHCCGLTRFGLTCGLLIALVCAGSASLAQDDRDHRNEQKQIGTIKVDASAFSPLLDLLSRHYSMVEIDALNPPSDLGPVLIGPKELQDQQVMAYVIHVYAAGLTVGIVDATQLQMDRFDSLVEGSPMASCEPAMGERRVALYAVQRSLQVLPTAITRYCVPGLNTSTERARKADLDMLGQLFMSQPRSHPLPSTDLVSASGGVNLENLSAKIACDEITSNQYAEMQQDLLVTSLRSFSAAAPRDYYLVEKIDQYKPGVSGYYFGTTAGQPTTVIARPSPQRAGNYLDGARLLFTEPDTTKAYVSGYTNSKETSVSGSVGFQGLTPNVSVEVGVTIGKSTSVTVPPTVITNSSHLIKATPEWYFRPASPDPGEVYSTKESWVWVVDRDVYPDAKYISGVATQFGASILPTYLFSSGQCSFPTPFPTWDVGAPHISSVEPTSTYRGGGTFIIHGEQLYPGIISNVLLGGDPLPLSNFVPIDDKSIRVVVPGGQRQGNIPVQVNTVFNGQTQFSNNNVTVKIHN